MALQDAFDVYLTHHYDASWERGRSEHQHKLIHRFLPKGQPLQSLGDTLCLRIQNWMNDYPRKQLGYQTPYELFVREFHKERQLRQRLDPVNV